jgi:hypothetical protein
MNKVRSGNQGPQRRRPPGRRATAKMPPHGIVRTARPVTHIGTMNGTWYWRGRPRREAIRLRQKTAISMPSTISG